MHLHLAYHSCLLWCTYSGYVVCRPKLIIILRCVTGIRKNHGITMGPQLNRHLSPQQRRRAPLERKFINSFFQHPQALFILNIHYSHTLRVRPDHLSQNSSLCHTQVSSLIHRHSLN